MLVIGESGGVSNELEREGELMFADSAASRCFSVRGFGGMMSKQMESGKPEWKMSSAECRWRNRRTLSLALQPPSRWRRLAEHV